MESTENEEKVNTLMSFDGRKKVPLCLLFSLNLTFFFLTLNLIAVLVLEQREKLEGKDCYGS